MTSKRKSLRRLAYAGLLLLATGCSGINASHSVSPMSFFLPGLLKADPPPPPPADETLPPMTSPKQVALVR